MFRELRDYDIYTEMRFFVDSPRKMRGTKSELIYSILKEYETAGVQLSIPLAIEFESDLVLGKVRYPRYGAHDGAKGRI